MEYAKQPRDGVVILVVEDEPIIRMVAVDALTDAGFELLEAEHAAEALIYLRQHAHVVKAICTDVHMPGEMNGVALAHETCKCWPWISILIVSGHAMPTQAELPDQSRFLPKPYALTDLVRHLGELTIA